MDNPAQLARIAAATGQAVRIYQLDRGYSVWGWLCPRHLELALQQGWEIKDTKPAPHELTCDWRNRGPCGGPVTARSVRMKEPRG